jgi:hypothetical protein
MAHVFPDEPRLPDEEEPDGFGMLTLTATDGLVGAMLTTTAGGDGATTTGAGLETTGASDLTGAGASDLTGTATVVGAGATVEAVNGQKIT